MSESIFIYLTDETEVCSSIPSLNNNHSHDADDSQVKPIKYVIDVIAPCLKYTNNLAISSGTFPKKMQIAKVLALYKVGNKNELGNYHPISILPVLKTLGKIIHSCIVSFCDKHSIITDFQYGFRKNRSTETALLVKKNKIPKHF